MQALFNFKHCIFGFLITIGAGGRTLLQPNLRDSAPIEEHLSIEIAFSTKVSPQYPKCILLLICGLKDLLRTMLRTLRIVDNAP